MVNADQALRNQAHNTDTQFFNVFSFVKSIINQNTGKPDASYVKPKPVVWGKRWTMNIKPCTCAVAKSTALSASRSLLFPKSRTFTFRSTYGPISFNQYSTFSKDRWGAKEQHHHFVVWQYYKYISCKGLRISFGKNNKNNNNKWVAHSSWRGLCMSLLPT